MAQVKVTVTDEDGKVIVIHDYDLAYGLKSLNQMESTIEEPEGRCSKGKPGRQLIICKQSKPKTKRNELVKNSSLSLTPVTEHFN